MSVSGFSVAHDAEVQQYRRMRAAFVAERKMREREEREKLEREKERRDVARQKGGEGGIGAKKKGGKVWTTLVGLGRGLTGGREAGGVVGRRGRCVEEGGSDEKAGVEVGVANEEEWSDAETEVDLIDILRDGKGDEGKNAGRREKAPPYVFLQSMAGVTAPLGRRG